MKLSDYSFAQMPYGYVYEIVNKINGKTYVGSRKLSLDTHWRKYMGSGKLVRSAILKYGSENFSKRFLGYAATLDELYSLETDWILYQKSRGLAQYNLFSSGHAGGDTFSRLNAKTMEEIRKKQSEGIKRHLQTNEVWNKGRTAANDSRIKVKSDRAKSRGTYSNIHLGAKRSDETRAKMSSAQIGNTNGDINKTERRRVEIAVAAKRRAVSNSGLNGFQLHEDLVSKMDVYDESVPLKEYARLIDIPYTTIRKFSYSHGATSRGGECLLCLARVKYPELLTADEILPVK